MRCGSGRLGRPSGPPSWWPNIDYSRALHTPCRGNVNQPAIGQFEQVVLTAIVDLADNAYGVTIHRTVGELSSPRSISLGAVYATLDRLEDKGLVASWLSDPTPQRGGRSRRHYRLEPAGVRALHESVRVAKRVCERVESTWGEQTWNTGGAWHPVRQS